MLIFDSPLLAATIEDITKLPFPLLATPKFDGIRCLTIPSTEGKRCAAVTRKWKPIPNDYVRNKIEFNLEPGFDGELIVPGEFHETSSAIMKKEGEPKFRYHIFDYVKSAGLHIPYQTRIGELCDMPMWYEEEDLTFLATVTVTWLFNVRELELYEETCLREGYEGVMLRRQLSSYKCGRSTLNEGKLLKLKRVDQSEAYIVGMFEEQANNNPLGQDAFGYAKRSTHKANKVGKGRLGGFICKPEQYGHVTDEERRWWATNKHNAKTAIQKHPYFFSVGSGINDRQREEWWGDFLLITKRITYAHQKGGAKKGGKPRFPRFKGFRDERD